MSDTGNVIELQLRANTAQLVSGLKDAAGATADMGRRMADDMKAAGGGAQFASPHIEGLGDAVRHYAKEMRQEGRLTRFLASDIEAMGIASKEATHGVAGLVAAFAVGNWTGVAIEGVKELVKHFNETDEALLKIKEDGEKSLESLKQKVKDVMLALSGATRAEIMQHKELDDLVEKRGKLEEDLASKQKDQADAAARLNIALIEENRTAAMKAATQRGVAAAEVESLHKQIDAVNELITAKKKLMAPAVSGLNAEDDRGAREKTAQDEANWRAAESQEWKKYYDRKTKDALDGLKTELDGQDQAALDAAKWRSNEQQEWKKYYDKVTAETQKWLEDTKKAEDEAFKKRKQEITAFANEVRTAITHSLRSLLDGTKSVEAALVDMMKGFAMAVVDGLLKAAQAKVVAAVMGKAAAKDEAVSTTQGHIAESVAGAYASQAFIPFVGPELGAEAAAGAALLLETMTAPMLYSARGLGRVPHDTIAMIHKDETVLPAPLAETYRQAAERGGMGGRPIIITIHAMDGHSVQRVVESNDFLNAVQEAVSNGRWPRT